MNIFDLFQLRKKNKITPIPLSTKEKEVLDQLDECAANFVFPMLDNGYAYLIDTRLSLFLKEENWAIIIQIIDYNYRAGAIENVLYTFGNCLKLKPGTNNENFTILFDISSIEDEDNNILVKPGIEKIKIKNEEVDMRISQEQLRNRNIFTEFKDRITIFELFRYLTIDFRELFFSKTEDLSKQLTMRLPEVLKLEEWFHPDLANGEIPSQNMTFRKLAKVISSGDTADYMPTEKTNTHWSNWPEGGAL